jgi:hypothetical protein
MIILGAGLAGCLAAIVNRDATIYEANDGPVTNHQALLRFRSDAISKVTGIPFRKVTVQKSIWYKGIDVAPSPRFTHMYSRKVVYKYMRRSIADTSSAVRYIAPPDFHEQLIAKLACRIQYNCPVKKVQSTAIRFGEPLPDDYRFDTDGAPIITTLPIHINSCITEINLPVEDCDLDITQIYISQYKVQRCDTFATVYFPDPGTPMYRASISGDLLIMESIEPIHHAHIDTTLEALGLTFGLSSADVIFSNQKHKNGKIVPIPEDIRRHFIFELTNQLNVYSLGRYATWRNVLLDDVLNDIYVINDIINRDAYSRQRGR